MWYLKSLNFIIFVVFPSSLYKLEQVFTNSSNKSIYLQHDQEICIE